MALFSRKHAARVPPLLDEVLPEMYWAAASNSPDELRKLTGTSDLFREPNLGWLPIVTLGYSVVVVGEMIGGPGGVATDDDLDGFLPDVLQIAAAVSPVPLVDRDVARLLRRVAVRPEEYEWLNTPSAFGLADLSGLVIIGAAAIVRAGWTKPEVETTYGKSGRRWKESSPVFDLSGGCSAAQPMRDGKPGDLVTLHGQVKCPSSPDSVVERLDRPWLAPLVTGAWLTVKDPKLRVLEAMPEQFLALQVELDQ